MKRTFLIILSILLFGFHAPQQIHSYKILYAEQFYRLFHYNFYQYPEDLQENIFYLEEALKADFCNPLNALARVENEKEWERYRNLFKMHVNLKLVELYLRLGSKYDKQVAYFFNEPWKKENIKSLEKAERIYSMASYYWEEAKRWASLIGHSYVTIEEVQYWEDENYRIWHGELDYSSIIQSHLDRVREVKQTFEEMDENTY